MKKEVKSKELERPRNEKEGSVKGEVGSARGKGRKMERRKKGEKAQVESLKAKGWKGKTEKGRMNGRTN